MTNLYPKLFDYNNNDDLYYDKIIEVFINTEEEMIRIKFE